MNQRWNNGSCRWRFEDVITPAEFEVAEIPKDIPAKEFILQHRYSREYPAARVRVGLYRKGELAGVAVFRVVS